MNWRNVFWAGILIFGLTVASTPSVSADVLQLSDFLNEMVSLDRFTEAPSPWYQTVQYSSYDRRSEGAFEPGWYANSDGFGNEPIPNVLAVLEAPTESKPEGRFLLVEENVPGVLVRTWTARMNGTLKVWLDGAEAPIYDGPAQSFLQETCRSMSSVFDPDRSMETDLFRQRDACYFPIPYSSGLRMEWTGRLDQLHFYHIEVRRYGRNVDIESLGKDSWERNRALIEETGRILQSPGTHMDKVADGLEPASISAAIDKGGETELLALEGPRKVVRLEIRVHADNPKEALRQTVLRVYFDGSSQPQVEAPVGDFFGSAPGVNPYDSVPFTVHADGAMVCRFPMAFAKSARFVAVNYSDSSVRLEGSAFYQTYEWDADRSMHLFSKWTVDHGLTAGPGSLSFDVPYFVGRGRGVLAGAATMILNPCPIPTSYGNWWGEGDEKIWVDNVSFPVFFGTGSEDYYNYSWSSPDLFAHAYCGQTHNTGPGNRGFVANHRWHILDPIPFEQQLDFYMELMHHVRTPGLSYARIYYVYARPDLRDVRRPITESDVQAGLELPWGWMPEPKMGANGATFIQAEDLEILAEGSGEVLTEYGRIWAGSQLGVWQPAARGDELEVSFRLDKGGRYQLSLACEKSPESGAAQVIVDGNEDSEYGVDLFQSDQTVLRSVPVAVLDLEAGTHSIKLISEGAHPEGKGMRIGVDFLWLQPR
jgi:hypothetical protein